MKTKMSSNVEGTNGDAGPETTQPVDQDAAGPETTQPVDQDAADQDVEPVDQDAAEQDAAPVDQYLSAYNTPFVFTLLDLQNTKEYRTGVEHGVKSAVTVALQMNPDEIKMRMLAWAAIGMPAHGELLLVPIALPTSTNPLAINCSDGLQRDFYNYIQWCIGTNVEDALGGLKAQLPDFIIHADYDAFASSIVLRVSVRA